MFEVAVYISSVFFLLQCLAFVVSVFTFCQMDIQFRSSVFVDEQERRHNSDARTLGSILQFVDFFSIQQKLSVSPGSMIIVGAIEILGNVHVLYPHFSSNNEAICVDQAGLSQAYALYFSACEYDARREFVHQEVVKLGLTVFDVYRFLLLFSHCPSVC